MALTDKLTAIADAIRGKTGKTDPLTLEQMVEEIEGIQAGEEVYTTPYGVMYSPDMTLDCEYLAFLLIGADKLKSIELTNWNPTDAATLKSKNSTLNDLFQSQSLERLLLPKAQYGGHYWARGATGLKTVQFGSIGYPVTSLAKYFFYNCTQTDLTITVYVDATTIAEATGILSNTPWGATNATIIYRNSTTGEVITE